MSFGKLKFVPEPVAFVAHRFLGLDFNSENIFILTISSTDR
jgi:hypothetical protein